MWVCVRCKEKLEDQFTSCWSCGEGKLQTSKNRTLRVRFDQTEANGLITYYNEKPFSGILYWAVSGLITREIEMVDGLKNGFYKDYYRESGIVKLEGNIINNKKEGVWKNFNATGELEFTDTYKNDVKIDRIVNPDLPKKRIQTPSVPIEAKAFREDLERKIFKIGGDLTRESVLQTKRDTVIYRINPIIYYIPLDYQIIRKNDYLISQVKVQNNEDLYDNITPEWKKIGIIENTLKDQYKKLLFEGYKTSTSYKVQREFNPNDPPEEKTSLELVILNTFCFIVFTSSIKITTGFGYRPNELIITPFTGKLNNQIYEGGKNKLINEQGIDVTDMINDSLNEEFEQEKLIEEMKLMTKSLNIKPGEDYKMEKWEYDNGQIKEIGCSLNSQKVGLWRLYYENGQLKVETFFNKEGNREGKYIEFYENGKIKEESKYKNNNKITE